jgi:hypothetical protein
MMTIFVLCCCWAIDGAQERLFGIRLPLDLLVPAQDYVGQFLATFRDYPQRQKAASFNMDEVLAKLRESK